MEKFLDIKGNRLINRIRVVSDSLTKIMEGGREVKAISSKLWGKIISILISKAAELSELSNIRVE